MTIIRAGIGGWTFPPWRGVFYPPRLPQAQELEYASSRVTTIEINATFYGSQKPVSFARWRAATPDKFVFSVKAPRGATHRHELADAAPVIARFLASGITELGDKLGPLLWQFPPTRRFDAVAFERFVSMLPASHDGLALRHVIEVRDASFNNPDYITLLRRFGVANAIVDSEKHVLLGDLTADFAYARLERNDAAEPEGYSPAALDGWADRARHWAEGRRPSDLPLALASAPAKPKPRDCFVYFISGDKVHAPAAAMAFLLRI